MRSIPYCAVSAPPVPPEALQRRRIADRVNVSPEVADVLALHAYGERHNAVLLIAADTSTLAEKVRR